MGYIARNAIVFAGTLATGSAASAGIVFQQDFSSSNTLGDYISATPNDGQFHDISADGALNTVALSGGHVVFDMEPDTNGSTAPNPNAGMLRADMSNTTGLMSLKMVFTYTRETAASNFGPGPSIQIGDFPTTATNYRSSVTADRFDEILFRRNGANNFWVELNDSTDRVQTPFGQATEITYFLNDSGSAASYVGPDGVTRSLNADAVALFVGTTLVAHNHAATNGASSDLTGFRFIGIDGGSATDFAIDSILIRDDFDIVPEPASLALLAIGGVTLLTARRGRAA